MQIETEARLGVFQPGDRLSIQFRGLWDWAGLGSGPAWLIAGAQLTQGGSGIADCSFSVEADNLTRALTGEGAPAPLSYVWQRDCGAGFADILGAYRPVLSFTPTASDYGCRYRCLILTPGAAATSDVARWFITPPELRLEHSASGLILTWPDSAVLESSPSPTGPWSPLANAASPFPVPTAGGQRFYRLARTAF